MIKDRLIVSTTINKPNTTCVLSLPFNNTPSHFISIGFNTTTTTTKNVLISSGLRIPTAASAFPGGGNISTADVSFSKKASNAGVTAYVSSRFAAFGNYRCSIKNNGAPFRAWIVFKDRQFGSHSAWFHTGVNRGFVADGLGSTDKGLGVSCIEDGGEDETVLTKEKSKEKPSRLHKRQRGSSSSGSAALMAGSPDLLIIPGVGPRNLRKLVEKGIGGVTKLKKLYKDKFFGKSSQKMVVFLVETQTLYNWVCILYDPSSQFLINIENRSPRYPGSLLFFNPLPPLSYS